MHHKPQIYGTALALNTTAAQLHPKGHTVVFGIAQHTTWLAGAVRTQVLSPGPQG